MAHVRHHLSTLHDWNVVATVRDHEFHRAIEVLSRLGAVGRTRFYNVLVMKVGDGRDTLEMLDTWLVADPSLRDVLARVVPATRTFAFTSHQEFEQRAGEAVLESIDALAGKSFHVRLHRRGLKGEIVSPEEERRLDALVLEHAERMGQPARVDFENPDAIVAVETIGRRGGLSVWTREDRARYPLLGLH